MSREELEQALTRLGQLLRERQVTGEIAVFGGAAMIIGFHFNRRTQDIDAQITEGHGQVTQAAHEVARELSLPTTWLNEQATAYLSEHREFSFFRTYPSEGEYGLRVMMAQPRYLLAMKLLGLRTDRDVPDVVHLARQLKLTTKEQLLSLLQRYYPDERVPAKRLARLDDVVRQLNEAP